MRTSFIWKIPKDKLIELVQEKNSLSEILRYFDINPAGNTRTLKKRLDEDNIDWSNIRQYGGIYHKKYKDKEVFTKNSSYDRSSLRKRILNQKLIDYKCQKCDLGDVWQKEAITLQLDHVNGISNDNRLENLRFLCPNCHSQTKTHAGKNQKVKASKERKRCECGKPIRNKSKKCKNCFLSCKDRPNTTKINWIDNETLEKLIWEMPTYKVGEQLGISAKAIEKRCKKYGIPKPGKGYWQKKLQSKK